MGSRKGNTEPRLFTPPLGELTPETSLGFEAVEFAESILGIELRPWQRWLLIHALELDPESGYEDYRFRTVIVEVGRQNGKTLVMVVLGLWRMFVDGASEILSAAQGLNVAEGTLADAFSMAKRVPELSRYLPMRRERGKTVPYMRTANGSNQMELASIPAGLEDVLDVSGDMPTWYVVPTNSGGGRSYSADLALLDELREHKNHDAWNAIVPATRERPRNQVWGFSNAGDRTSVVLKKYRNIALKALEAGATDQERLAYFSWSAEPGCSIFDPDGWAAANPSLGYGARTERDMLAEAKQAVDPTDPNSSEDGFRTEYLCQWVDSLEQSKFPIEAWDDCLDDDSVPVGPVHVAVDVALDGRISHIVGLSELPDGRWYVEHIASQYGIAWVAPWLASRRGSWFDGTVAVNARQSPATVLIPDLKKHDLTVAEWQGPDVSATTMAFYELVVTRMVRHRAQPMLDDAVAGSKAKSFGDAWSLDRVKSRKDVTPLIAAVGAYWLATRTTEDFESAYADDDWDEELGLDDDMSSEPDDGTVLFV